MIIDTHTHYTDEDYNEDRDEIIRSLSSFGITAVSSGADMKSIRAAFALAQKYPNIYCTIGNHPAEVAELTETDMDEMEKLSDENKVLAIGEIGLDYHYDDDNSVPKDIQKKWFVRQLELAKKVKLPVVIHSRDAAFDTMDIMKGENAGINGGIVHCYSYGVEQAKEYLAMGMHFGIGGVITYKNAKKLVEVVEYLPMDAIVLETDCPYLAPTGHRGERNTSLYLPLIIDCISEIKGMSSEEVISITEDNARKVFPKLGKIN